MKKLLFTGAIVLLATGCIPPGEPPVGNITANVGKIPVTPEEKRERMITELTTLLFSYLPGGALQFHADAASTSEMHTVIRECAKITGISCDFNSPWHLYSRHIAGEWVVDLIHDGKMVRSIRIQL